MDHRRRADELPEGSGPRGLVVATLRGRIEGGELRTGDALPSERALAVRLGVSRDTVRAALEELAEQGWIETGRGNRKRVGRNRPAPAGELANCIAFLSAEDSQAFDAGKPWVEDRYVMALAAARLEQHGYHIVNLSMPALRLGRNQPFGAGRMRATVIAANLLGQPVVDRLVADLDRNGSRTVLYGCDDGQAQRPAVFADHRAGARQLVEWLHGGGRRRIACAWIRSAVRPWMDERYAGYAAAMRDLGLEPLPLIEIPRLSDGDEGQDAFDRQARVAAGFLSEHLRGDGGPDALMALNDPQAICLAAACRKLGIAPNADVWLAGYDDSWRYAREWRFEAAGPLVTIDKRNVEMARLLADLVLARIDAEVSDAPARIRCEPRLVVIDPATVPGLLSPPSAVLQPGT